MTTRPRNTLTPRYVEKFSCVGPDCPLNCCGDWAIELTKPEIQALKKPVDPVLRNFTGNLLEEMPGTTQRLRVKLKLVETRHVCPMLNDDGLCHIHSKWGEKLLPNICRTYPRRNFSVGDLVIQRLNLSCPEAARLILLDPEGMHFSQHPVADPSAFDLEFRHEFDPSTLRFWQAGIEIIKSSQHQSAEESLFGLALLFYLVIKAVEKGQPPEKAIQDTIQHVETGGAREQFASLAIADKVQAVAIQNLFKTPEIASNQIYRNYRVRFQEAVVNLGGDVQEKEVHASAKDILEACNEGFDSLQAGYRHAFINFLLHRFCTHLYDTTDAANLEKKIKDLILDFFFIKLHLGLLYGSEEDDSLIVGVVYSISRATEHLPIMRVQAQNLEKEGLYTLSHFFSLIKT